MTREEKAIKDMEDMIGNYKWTYDRDPDMLKMYREDRKDFSKILKLMKAGKWNKAFNKAEYLDTAARDFIPDSSWDFMGYITESV
jgi:hypothetical protein